MTGFNPAGNPPEEKDPDKALGIRVVRGVFGDRVINPVEFNERLCKALNNLEERLAALEETTV